jgi:hypothetical protein
LAKRLPSGRSAAGGGGRRASAGPAGLQQPLHVGRLEQVDAADHVGDPLQASSTTTPPGDRRRRRRGGQHRASPPISGRACTRLGRVLER